MTSCDFYQDKVNWIEVNYVKVLRNEKLHSHCSFLKCISHKLKYIYPTLLQEQNKRQSQF